jgi:hypothetical protein
MKMAEKEFIRPSKTRTGGAFDWYRLKAFDPDPEEKIPLWPERYSAKRIHEIRYGAEGKGGMLPHEFARLFLCEPLDESAARCSKDWIEKCKLKGLGLSFVNKYEGKNPVYTGLDLGIGSGTKNDLTCFFTFELLPDGTRKILDIESGRWSGPRIIEKIIDKTTRFKSAIRVENNAAQDYIRQFAIDKKKDLKIKAHTTTGANKRNLDFGVESVFTEIQNQAWIIPCNTDGKCDPETQAWIDDMIYYQPPPAHTGDRLMACWIGREAVRHGGSDVKPFVGGPRLMTYGGGF